MDENVDDGSPEKEPQEFVAPIEVKVTAKALLLSPWYMFEGPHNVLEWNPRNLVNECLAGSPHF